MRTINMFQGFTDKVPYETSLEEVVNLIRTDASLRERTEKYRNLKQQGMAKAASGVKASLPVFAVAVRFAGGKQLKHIESFTGLVIVDIDHLPDGEADRLFPRICNLPRTFLAYRTVSGCGIRIIARYEWKGSQPLSKEQQVKFYQQVVFADVNRFFADLLGVSTDEKCKNVTRLSALAYDAEVCYRPDAESFEYSDGHLRLLSRHQVSLERAVKAAEQILEEEGVEYVPHHHNEYISRMGYLLNAFGVSFDKAEKWALQQFTGYDGDISSHIRSCYTHVDEFGTRSLPRVKGWKKEKEGETYWATVDDITEFLHDHCELRYNVVLDRTEIRWKKDAANASLDNSPFRPLNDRDENSLWKRMNSSGQRTRMNDLRYCIGSELVEEFNPFVHYFENLPAWDGQTDYIGQLARTVHVAGSQDEFVELFRKWFVSMVPSLLDEEVVNHEILVFIGKQGTYKSTFFARLMPPELRDYFRLKSNFRRMDKDDLLALSEFSLVCFDEIDTMTNTELNQLKSMTTAPDTNERAPYARHKKRRVHIATFCGTGNNRQFLVDTTGNRRWIAVEVLSIDSPIDHPFHYDGIYSQAYALWKSGYRYWLNGDEMERLSERNRQFEAICIEEELLNTYFRVPAPGEAGVKFMKISDLLERISGNVRQPLSLVRIGQSMIRLGFQQKRTYQGRGYLVIERTIEEIRAEQSTLGHYMSRDSALELE